MSNTEIHPLTGINFLYVRQRQLHLVPVHSRTSQLQGVRLEVHCIQLFFVLELLLNLLKRVK